MRHDRHRRRRHRRCTCERAWYGACRGMVIIFCGPCLSRELCIYMHERKRRESRWPRHVRAQLRAMHADA